MQSVRLYANPNYGAGFPGFFRWLQENHPQVYDAATDRLPEDVTMGATDATSATPSMAQQIISTVKDAAAAIIPLYTQKQVLDMQLARAKAGLPPVDTTAIQNASALNVGVAPATRNTLLIVAGLAVAGLLLFRVLGRRR